MRNFVLFVMFICLLVLSAKLGCFNEANDLQQMADYDAQMKAAAIRCEQLKAEGIYPYEY